MYLDLSPIRYLRQPIGLYHPPYLIEKQNKTDLSIQDDQNKNDQNKDADKSEKPKENKNQQSKLSPQQIKNLLKAMENAEKKVQAKVNDKKQKGTKVVSEKDW